MLDCKSLDRCGLDCSDCRRNRAKEQTHDDEYDEDDEDEYDDDEDDDAGDNDADDDAGDADDDDFVCSLYVSLPGSWINQVLH